MLMKIQTTTLFFLPLLLLLLSGCGDATPAERTPIAMVSETPTSIPPTPTASPTPASPTATSEPSPTPGPASTPTPLAVATAPPTLTPTKTRLTLTNTPTPVKYRAKADASLEWILPEPTPSNPISVSGGLISGYGVDGDLVHIFMGRTMVIVDMGESPIGEEVARFVFSGRPTSSVRSGRFLFVFVVGEGVKVFDFTDPANAAPVALIKGVGSGRLHLGENNEVLFERSEGTWLELDVDQVAPVFWLPEPPKTVSAFADPITFLFEIYDPNYESIQGQIDELIPRTKPFLPDDVLIIENEAFYWATSRGEGGAGQVVRLDITDPENPIVKSIYQSFDVRHFDYENGRIYSTTFFEASFINVENPTSPQRISSKGGTSQVLKVKDDLIFSGGPPGLEIFSTSDPIDPLGEAATADLKEASWYMRSMVVDPNRPYVYGISGVYGYQPGIPIFKTEPADNPQIIAFVDKIGVWDLKLAGETLFTFRTRDGADESEVFVINVTDPANPIETESFTVEEGILGFEIWQDDVGRTIMLLLLPNSGLQFWNVTNPAERTLLSTIAAPEACQYGKPNSEIYVDLVNQTAVDDGMLFTSIGTCPISRIDVSDPTNPIILDTLEHKGPLVYEDGLLFMGGENLRIYNFDD